MQSGNLFNKSVCEYGESTRDIKLPNSGDPSHINHSIRVVNKANSVLLIRTNNKKWKLAAKASASFSYDGDNWVKQGVVPVQPKKVECPHSSSSSCSSSSSEDDCNKPGRGPRGPPGRDGCNGANGQNGKNGKCECQHSIHTRVEYVGTARQSFTAVQVPCWVKTVTVIAVAGGGSGGNAASGDGFITAGSGGGSGHAIAQNIPVAGGFLTVNVGQGGRTATPNGATTSVAYVGPVPYNVFATGGVAGAANTDENIQFDISSGQYGGGGGDGNPDGSLRGSGFQWGNPAIPGVSGGSGGGLFPGAGGTSSLLTPVYGGGGGGSSPGPVTPDVAGSGRGGGTITLNGTAGARGGGGGGAGAAATLPVALGVPGNGGDGYVDLYFFN